MADARRGDRHARKAMCIRLPDELHDRVRAEAEARDVAMNWLVTRAVAEFMERLVPAEDWRLTRD